MCVVIGWDEDEYDYDDDEEEDEVERATFDDDFTSSLSSPSLASAHAVLLLVMPKAVVVDIAPLDFLADEAGGGVTTAAGGVMSSSSRSGDVGITMRAAPLMFLRFTLTMRLGVESGVGAGVASATATNATALAAAAAAAVATAVAGATSTTDRFS